MSLILGLNAFHADAAAALVRDGQVIAAAEEEHFRLRLLAPPGPCVSPC